ncbi:MULTISPECIES: hypothetical protein [Parachlamydia]|jgi:type IV pilus assembly protein PilM|uniref:hypothetical protein n=1 Tax=Parachlamydia TaxID=83551 RepID=UPI0001C17BBE|nr:hypothetical protein [Parachlamydia acanthamoebae]EFB42068.1 hypothetical protein pah_c016o136 [Parachlamydia acanthamoebae str. Hall's coccus]
MLDSPNALHVLGLDIESNKLKGILLTEVKGKPSLIRILFSETLSNGSNSSFFSQETAQTINTLSANALVGVALKTDEVLIRPLEVKLKKEQEIASIIDFQSEPLLPFPVENAIVEWTKLGTTTDGSKLTIIAARKDYVEKELAKWNTFHVEPELLSCAPAALAAFSSQFCDLSGPQLILHIGSSGTSCVMAEEGRVIAAQSVPRGIEQLVQAFQQDLLQDPLFKERSFASLKSDELKNLPSFAENLDRLRIDVTRIVLGISKQIKGFEPQEVFLTGEIGQYPELINEICQNLQLKILQPIEHQNFILNREELQSYAIPIGIALTGLPNWKEQINFRQKQYNYPHPWKRLKKSIVTYFGACVFLAFALYCFGSAYLSKQTDHLRTDYVNLLASMHQSYPEFEELFRKKNGLEPISTDEDLDPMELSIDDLSARVQFLNSLVSTSPDSYPLFPNTPAVSDVLAWLAKHPSFNPSENADEQKIEGLKIESFTYKMVKKPDKSKKNEIYQVRVDLDFSAPTPTQAREFHDSLIAPNEMVDPKGEIKWGTNRGRYHTSFFLKDRTLYPSSIK